MVIPGIDSYHEDSPALTLVSRLVRCNYLHQKIREQGGAYGAGCSSGNESFPIFHIVIQILIKL
eukprot:UN22774